MSVLNHNGQMTPVGRHREAVNNVKRQRSMIVAFVIFVLMAMGVGMASSASARPFPAPAPDPDTKTTSTQADEPSQKPSDDPSSSGDSSDASDSSSSSSAATSAAVAQGDDYSFYKLSSSTSTYFGNALSPSGASSSSSASATASDASASGDASGSADPSDAPSAVEVGADECAGGTNTGSASNCWSNILSSAANGGDVVGFTDKNMSNGLTNYLGSQLSASSMNYSYDSFKNLTYKTTSSDSEDSSTSIGLKLDGPLDYLHYGATLEGVGLDSTGTKIGEGNWHKVSGGIMFLFYLAALSVDLIFRTVIEILSALNPFRLFSSGVRAVSPSWADAMSGTTPLPEGPMSDVANKIGDIYKAMHDLMWQAMAPIFLATLIGFGLMFRSFNWRTGARKTATRLLFVMVGVPLLGGMYTSTLDAMGNITNSGTATSNSNKVIHSTYVDFRNWARDSRLAAPNSEVAQIGWNSITDEPTDRSVVGVRNAALAINGSIKDGGGTNLLYGSKPSSTGLGTTASDQVSWNTSMIDGPTTSKTGEATIVGNTIAMLQDYMSGDQVTGSDFESAVKGRLNTYILNQSAKFATLDGKGQKPAAEVIKSWFVDFGDPTQMASKHANENPLLSVDESSGLNTNGTTRTSDTPRGHTAEQVDESRGEDKGYYSFASTDVTAGCGYDVSSATGTPIKCNLSPLAMYNYLNTDFSAKSATVYSSANANSTATRKQHMAVTQVGKGAMAYVYWFNAVSILAAFAIIGWAYGFAIIVASMHRSYQLIMSVFPAMAGMINSIAKVITYSLAMIFEVLVTIILYGFVQDIIYAMSYSIAPIIGKALDSTDASSSSAVLGNGAMIVGVATVLCTLLTIGATIIALKARKSSVAAINESASRTVEKFLLADQGSAHPNAAHGGMAGNLAHMAGQRAVGGISHGLGQAHGANKVTGEHHGSGIGKHGAPGGIGTDRESLAGSATRAGAGGSAGALGAGLGGPGGEPGGAGGLMGDFMEGDIAGRVAAGDGADGAAGLVDGDVDGSGVMESTGNMGIDADDMGVAGGDLNANADGSLNTNADDQSLASEVLARGGLDFGDGDPMKSTGVKGHDTSELLGKAADAMAGEGGKGGINAKTLAAGVGAVAAAAGAAKGIDGIMNGSEGDDGHDGDTIADEGSQTENYANTNANLAGEAGSVTGIDTTADGVGIAGSGANAFSDVDHHGDTSTVGAVSGDHDQSVSTSNDIDHNDVDTNGVVTGDSSSVVSGDSSAVIGDSSSVVNGDSSSVIGGDSSSVAGDSSSIIGDSSSSIAGGSTSVTGDTSGDSSVMGDSSSISGGSSAGSPIAAGESSISVAGRDFAEVGRDVMSGNFTEAVRDMSAGVQAVFGNTDASESVLRDSSTFSGGSATSSSSHSVGAAGAAGAIGAAAASAITGSSGDTNHMVQGHNVSVDGATAHAGSATGGSATASSHVARDTGGNADRHANMLGAAARSIRDSGSQQQGVSTVINGGQQAQQAPMRDRSGRSERDFRSERQRDESRQFDREMNETTRSTERRGSSVQPDNSAGETQRSRNEENE